VLIVLQAPCFTYAVSAPLSDGVGTQANPDTIIIMNLKKNNHSQSHCMDNWKLLPNIIKGSLIFENYKLVQHLFKVL
jgi:hypothetical protein